MFTNLSNFYKKYWRMSAIRQAFILINIYTIILLLCWFITNLFIEKNIIGHAHYRGSPNPVRGKDIGFLDDIYVNPKHRNTGVAYKIIERLSIEGKKNKWELIRWNCSSENTNAINFYNKFAKKLEWHTFEIKI